MITVIVLIILAGISISMLNGNNGILKQTQNAKESTVIGQEKQAISLGYSGCVADNLGGSVSATQLQKEMENNGEKNFSVTGNGDTLTIKYNETKHTYTIKNGVITQKKDGNVDAKTLLAMYNQAVADNCTNQDGTCTNENHLHIGDFVNYGKNVDYSNTENGTYSVGEDVLGVNYEQRYDLSLNQLNWRVMGIDSTTGGIKIMASQPMKKSNDDGTALNDDPYLYMNGAKAYINSLTELKNICKMYTTSYGDARSITRDDIDKLTGITTTELKKQNNLDAYKGFKNLGEEYGPLKNQYTPESWLNNKTKTTVSGTVTEYYYSVNSQCEEGAPFVTMSNTRVYNMLFYNTDVDGGRAYWLASLGVCGNDYYAGFGVEILDGGSGSAPAGAYMLFTSYGNEKEHYAAVCPVVSLNSNVTKEQVPKISDINEKEWNYYK